MEPWRKSWRMIMPHLSTIGLEALQQELERPTGELIQNEVVLPINHDERDVQEPLAACAIGITYWKGAGAQTIGTVHDAFNHLCNWDAQIESVDTFIGWYDIHPNPFPELLPEVKRELARRSLMVVELADTEDRYELEMAVI